MTTVLARGKHVLVRADLDGRSRILSDGGVVYRDGTILDVGPFEELRRRYAPDQLVGNGRQFLMPGLINAHHHGFGMTYHQLGVRDTYLELRGLWGRGGRSLDPYTMTLYTAMGHLRTGTTTVMLKDSAGPPVQQVRHSVDEKLRAYQDAGIRHAYSLNYMNRCILVMGDDHAFVESLPPELAEQARELIRDRFLTMDEYEDICRDLARRFPAAPESMVRILVSPQEYRWVDEAAMVRLKELAQRPGSRDPRQQRGVDVSAPLCGANDGADPNTAAVRAWLSGPGGCHGPLRVAHEGRCRADGGDGGRRHQ